MNVQNTTSIEDLDKVKAQLGNKYDGLNRSLKKVNERFREIEGQTSMLGTGT